MSVGKLAVKKVLLTTIGLEVLALSLLVFAAFGNPLANEGVARDGDPFPKENFPDDDKFPAYPPASVSASNQGDGVLIEWVHKGGLCAPSNIIRVHHYSVYRREPGATGWTELFQEPGTNDCPEVFQFLDTTARPGRTYVYGVSIVKNVQGGREGPESEVMESAAINAR